MTKMECGRCAWDFPEDLSAYSVSWETDPVVLCSNCANELTPCPNCLNVLSEGVEDFELVTVYYPHAGGKDDVLMCDDCLRRASIPGKGDN